VKLVGAHALLGRTEKMDCKQPFVERDVAVLEDGIHGHGELLPALRALVDAGANVLALLACLRRELVDLRAIAVRAYGAIGPPLGLKEQPGRFGIA